MTLPMIPTWLNEFAPIGILLVVVGIVLARLPSVEGLNHTPEYRKRRVFNWMALGLTYAFLYMARYNIKVSQYAFGEIKIDPDGNLLFGEAAAQAQLPTLMSNADFSTIFMWGTITYGCSFLINGPLTDRLGGKFSILMGAAGAAIMNLAMGFITWQIVNDGQYAETFGTNLTLLFSILYSANMYFQSFGAVAIVKCNAPWFHVRERGVFGAIFGILISLGVYFAYDINKMIIERRNDLGEKFYDFGALPYVFLIPTILLTVFFVVNQLIVRNTPGEAGFKDFDTADASSGDDGPQLGAVAVFKKMLTNPIIITIAFIEFCSGFLRQAIMQWGPSYFQQTGCGKLKGPFVDGEGAALFGKEDVVATIDQQCLNFDQSFVMDNWGMLLCCAGIMGGVFAGVISDRVFQSRRGPVAAVLYGLMLLGGIVMVFTYKTPLLPWLIIFMSMCIIGVHGMLSGTASMDFGGKKNVGVAVGIIDGFVYAGTAVMSFTYARILPSDELAEGQVLAEAADPSNWLAWPWSMIPVALIGLILATRIWNAKPKGKKAPEPEPEAA